MLVPWAHRGAKWRTCLETWSWINGPALLGKGSSECRLRTCILNFIILGRDFCLVQLFFLVLLKSSIKWRLHCCPTKLQAFIPVTTFLSYIVKVKTLLQETWLFSLKVIRILISGRLCEVLVSRKQNQRKKLFLL